MRRLIALPALLASSVLASPAVAAPRLIGTSVASVTVWPHPKTLDAGTLNIVTASSDQRYQVRVLNGGDTGLRRVQVRFAATGTPARVKVVPELAAHHAATLRFHVPPRFGAPLLVRVSTKPVAHETNAANNAVAFRVQYRLG